MDKIIFVYRILTRVDYVAGEAGKITQEPRRPAFSGFLLWEMRSTSTADSALVSGVDFLVFSQVTGRRRLLPP